MAAAFAAMLSLAGWVPAQAANDSVDQAQTLTLSSQRQITMMAQTFTAGMTGQLDRLTLAYDTPTGFASLRVSIRTINSNGQPSSTTLGTTVAWQGSVVCCRGFHDFNINPTVAIAGGTHYAIVVQTVSGVLTWYNDSTVDAYAGGQAFVACSGCAWLTGSQFGMDFAFKTWVATSVNSAPVLTSDSAAVTVNEGTAPTNTGTFSDPDGDSLTLSASSGAVNKTGAGSGTWSWTQAASDEGPRQTITITADDGQGHSVTTSFTLSVVAVAPTAQIVTDPTEVPEGTTEPFTGAASSPASADNSAGFSYTWHVTKNGGVYASGSGKSFSFTPNDEGTYVVTFQATDDGGMSGSDSMTVIGTNVAPTATIKPVQAAAPLVIAPQELLTFSGTFTDPSTLDTHTAIWDFGDGSSASGFTAAHAYAAAGTYRVTLTVTDDDGGVGHATIQVPVQTTQQALGSISGYVQKISTLNAGQKNSLTAKLNAASAAAARGDTNAANDQLNAFLNEVRADQNTGKLSAGDATTLSNAVHAVKGALGTFNRFLEWWPLGL